MSNAQYSELCQRGIKPPEVQYFILYYSCLVPGIQSCFTWSADGLDAVIEIFKMDYAEHRPEVRLAVPTDCN